MVHNGDRLIFNLKQAHNDALAALRKESLDIYNRLHSIEEDLSFVNQVYQRYSEFPLIPNLRCGAWYTDPAIASETPAYFKSTDGHTGNWGFNLRRANLHLLKLIPEKSGIILVDSTRAGKRMPDALSRTVPIWCAVVNRAILRRRQQYNIELRLTSDWDTDLYTPPGIVSAQEHHQIAAKLDGWAMDLVGSSFELPLDLAAPLRPFWITPSTTTFPMLGGRSTRTLLPIICVSASKHVEAGTERRVAGYAYVQGSGDDHELWGMGLTPQIFWKHRTDLISTPRANLEQLIKQILVPSSSGSDASSAFSSSSELQLSPTPIRKIDGWIQLGSFSPSDLNALVSSLRSRASANVDTAYIILDFTPSAANGDLPVAADHDTPFPQNMLHILASPKGKAKQDAHFFQNILLSTISFIRTHLSAESPTKICIYEGRGNDPGTLLDLSVGVAVAAIQLFFDRSGNLTVGDGAKIQADKQSIRQRLEWIIGSEPRANPSRATLKRVNEVLLTPSVFPSKSSS